MTKPRLSWSKARRQVAALAAGLLLLHGAVAARPAARSVKAPLEAATGPADILETDTIGLRGQASFYGTGFHGRRTSTGEHFDVRQFTAASNHFPLGSWVAVRRLDDGQCVIVKVNDRMHARHRRRVIDVSRGVAEYLDMLQAGVVLVRVAPVRDGWREQGLAGCHAAFDPEPACASCGQPPKLPVFDAYDN